MYIKIERNFMMSIHPNIIVFLYANVDQLLNNINKRGRPYEKTTTTDYLNRIQNSYLQYFQTHPELNILYLNVNRKDFIKYKDEYNEIKKVLNFFI